MFKFNFTNKKIKKGFALLYAVLVAGVVLAVGLLLGSIISKNIMLSTLIKNSQISYYSADSGRDCAIFWDVYNESFDPSIPAGVINLIKCSGDSPQEISPTSLTFDSYPNKFLLPLGIDMDDPAWIFSFSFNSDLSSGQTACTKVDVIKYGVGCNTDLYACKTVIVSSGYNFPCGSSGNPPTTPRTVERSIVTRY